MHKNNIFACLFSGRVKFSIMIIEESERGCISCRRRMIVTEINFK